MVRQMDAKKTRAAEAQAEVDTKAVRGGGAEWLGGLISPRTGLTSATLMRVLGCGEQSPVCRSLDA